MNTLMVVDASLAVKWLVPEEHSDKADALGRLWFRQGSPSAHRAGGTEGASSWAAA